MERSVGFSPEGAARVIDATRRVELDPRVGGEVSPGIDAPRQWQVSQWVTIDSLTLSGPYYSGNWYLRSGNTNSFTSFGNKIWVNPPNGTTLALSTYYRGFPSGIYSDREVFDIVEGTGGGGAADAMVHLQSLFHIDAHGLYQMEIVELDNTGTFTGYGATVDVADPNGLVPDTFNNLFGGYYHVCNLQETSINGRPLYAFLNPYEFTLKDDDGGGTQHYFNFIEVANCTVSVPASGQVKIVPKVSNVGRMTATAASGGFWHALVQSFSSSGTPSDGALVDVADPGGVFNPNTAGTAGAYCELVSTGVTSSGGHDEYVCAQLPTIWQKAGTVQARRIQANFIQQAPISVNVQDNSGNSRVDVTVGVTPVYETQSVATSGTITSNALAQVANSLTLTTTGLYAISLSLTTVPLSVTVEASIFVGVKRNGSYLFSFQGPISKTANRTTGKTVLASCTAGDVLTIFQQNDIAGGDSFKYGDDSNVGLGGGAGGFWVNLIG